MRRRSLKAALWERQVRQTIHLAGLGYYLLREVGLEEAEDPRFVPGRSGALVYKGKRIGSIGEVHPAVLAAWGIQMPCAALELELEALLET
jgi:phenylalanyl-tRNA synthetase beta chain